MVSLKYYILDDANNAVRVGDVRAYAEWQVANMDRRHVGDDQVGGVRVSTIFLGWDHSFLDRDKPILFETMVFRGGEEAEQERYDTWEQAARGHRKWVEVERAKVLVNSVTL